MKIVNVFQALTIFAKIFIVDVWQGYEYVSGGITDKIHIRLFSENGSMKELIKYVTIKFFKKDKSWVYW